MTELISYGAGVNSTAMTILLVNEGWHGPIVFAKTGTEWPETDRYLDYFEQEWLRPRGLEITRLGSEWRQRKAVQNRSLVEYCEHYAYIPSLRFRWCTVDYKVKPINAFAEARGITVQLVGIAADEAKRRREDRTYPLLDRGITRQGCIEIIQAAGLDVPMKSGCYICPGQSKSEWIMLWQRHPELFERAARLEEMSIRRARAKDKRALTLDPNGKTLRQRVRDFQIEGIR